MRGRKTSQRGKLWLEQEHVLTAHLRGADLCLSTCLLLVRTYEAGGIIIAQIFKIRELTRISQMPCPSSHSWWVTE